MDTIFVKMEGKNGRIYELNPKHYKRLEDVFIKAKTEMTSPSIFHMLSWITDAEKFRSSKRDLIKLFKRKLKKQYKNLKQTVPDTLIAYSIEYKETDLSEITIQGCVDNLEHLNTEEKLPFLHLHFYVIADCNKCMPQGFVKYATAALNEIEGLSKARYFKSKSGQIYKRLNIEAEAADAFHRMKYIAKIEQKTPEIPYRETFGASLV